MHRTNGAVSKALTAGSIMGCEKVRSRIWHQCSGW